MSTDAHTDFSSLPAVDEDGRILCHIDGEYCHVIAKHIQKFHADEWTVERYKQEFPHAPLFSEWAREQIRRRQNAKKSESVKVDNTAKKQSIIDLFGVSKSAAMTVHNTPVMASVLDPTDNQIMYVPDCDSSYVFSPNALKSVLMAFELNLPMLLWGYHGTGKTTLFEQVCAVTRRAFMRVQHTINTEEAHILGQYVVHEGSTIFQPGPLTVALAEGHVYCADEYDFAPPSVLSVYQPVLEGKPLVIKDAPPEYRIVRPHKDFRFVATGNTNGGGDETGLYQGTQMQNAANYSRFAIVEEMQYMEPAVETSILMSKVDGIKHEDAKRIVQFANDVREAFKNGEISSTMSPREVFNSGLLGLVTGAKWRRGLELGFTNRLNRVDKEVVDSFAQRIFG